jgi:predicted acyltransferase
MQSDVAAVRTKRLVSLDLLRGLTIAGMILVNNAGNEEEAYWPLRHAEWNGWTPTDLVFPFFLFMVGVALVYSFQSRLARGDSRGRLMAHTVQRSALIFIIGVVLHGIPEVNPLLWRVMGVLQRIALCYLIASILTIYASRRVRILTIVVTLFGYWILMCFVPVPGFGLPGRDIPRLHPDWNLGAWLDRKLLMGHLDEGTRDPEGLLSTIPSIATCLLGVLTGEYLRSARDAMTKIRMLAMWGVAGLIAGEIWGIWFPINKKLWTSSYVLFVGGFAAVGLALCYWLVDVRGWKGKWKEPLLMFGTNALTAYIVSELLSTILGIFSVQERLYQGFFRNIVSPAFGSLLYSISFVLVCLLPNWLLYRKKILVKV